MQIIEIINNPVFSNVLTGIIVFFGLRASFNRFLDETAPRPGTNVDDSETCPIGQMRRRQIEGRLSK